ncbi:hypothetical protein BMS3Bbin07_00485 [bacterium BMS3Bbin07]|nr:hypothetical protein BMS3Bbin07_00485 [bacterium BMS3Bbin07]
MVVEKGYDRLFTHSRPGVLPGLRGNFAIHHPGEFTAKLKPFRLCHIPSFYMFEVGIWVTAIFKMEVVNRDSMLRA